MTRNVIPLPTLEILTKARAVITRPNDYPEDVVLTAIQTLMWRGNWIDQDRARMLLRAMQDQKMRRWLAEKDAAEKAALKAKRTARLRAFNRQVLKPMLWVACGFALAALALATMSKAATHNDLTMTVIDGRPAFRPADGLDCYTSKWGGQVIDCALADAAVVRPRRAPCWLRPDLVGACPVGRAVMASLPPMSSTFARPRYGSPFPQRPVIVGGGGHDAPREVPAVPLPASFVLLAGALALLRRLA